MSPAAQSTANPRPALRLADCYWFFGPLVLMVELNMISKSVIHAFLARTDAPSVALAAFNSAFTLYFATTSTTEVMALLCLSFLKSQADVRRLMAFTALVLLLPIAMALAVCFTSLGDIVFGGWFGLGAEARIEARNAVGLLTLSAPVLILRGTAFALLMGLGGGFIRDILIGNLPAESLRSPWYLVTIMGGVLVVLLVGRHVPRVGPMMVFLNALAMGLFAVTGVAYATEFGLSFVPAVLIGTLSAIGGGVLVVTAPRQGEGSDSRTTAATWNSTKAARRCGLRRVIPQSSSLSPQLAGGGGGAQVCVSGASVGRSRSSVLPINGNACCFRKPTGM